MLRIIDKIAETIRNNSKFLILVHSNPDGDAIGSSLALALFINRLKKKIKILLPYRISERYYFLPGFRRFITAKLPSDKPEVVFILDTAGWNQIEKIKSGDFKKAFLVNIDHHIDNKKFGHLNWIDTKASAVGEQIFRLGQRLCLPLTKDIATCIYTAIVTDSGSFRYSNTTARTHNLASRLLNYGLKPEEISSQLFENIPLCKLQLLQQALSTIKQSSRGQIIWMWITKKMFQQTKTKPEHTEEFIDFLKCVSGTRVAIVFKQGHTPNEYRVTFRSRNSRISVNEIAHKFNGGGHPAAAGCTIFGTREKVEKTVIKEVDRVLKNHHYV